MNIPAAYTAVANALVPELNVDIDTEMDKAGYGVFKGMIPQSMISPLAGAVAKKAVDTFLKWLDSQGLAVTEKGM